MKNPPAETGGLLAENSRAMWEFYMLNKSKCQEQMPKRRAALYVDGFNLYHPINDWGEPYLKWINLRRLAEIIIPSHDEEVVLVKYFTARRHNSEDGVARHITYINAMMALGVTTILGHYIAEPKECSNCGHKSQKKTEKQTDINLALSVTFDAVDDLYDHAYLLSADSDQAATARVFKERFGGKRLTSVAPPGRPVSEKVMSFAGAKILLNRDHIERIVMPMYVQGKAGVIRRPAAYDPPPEWVHPDKRPKP